MYVVRFEIQLIITFGLRSLSSIKSCLLFFFLRNMGRIMYKYIEFCFGQQKLFLDLGFP